MKHQRSVPVSNIVETKIVKVNVTPKQLCEAANYMVTQSVKCEAGDGRPRVVFYSDQEQGSTVEVHLVYAQEEVRDGQKEGS